MSAVEVHNRETILADFQACTGIHDIGEAILHLEQSNWDLLHAINSVLPENSQTLPSERSSVASQSESNLSNMSKRPNSNHALPSVPNLIAHNSTSENHQTVPSLPTRGPSVPVLDTNRKVVDLTDGSETSSDVEDLTEPFTLDDDFHVPETKQQPQERFLITDNVDDEETGTVIFSHNFVTRYGHCHPMFFHGSLEAAVREATHCPAKERRLLAMYLHHDSSVLSNVFCQQVLCAESIVDFLTSNFVVWGWDVTHESNRQMLLASVSRSFGPSGVATIRSFDMDRYPVIILVSRIRAATEIVSVVSGTVGVDETMGSLLHALEMYRAQQVLDIREEEEREARERVIREQNEAYQESLRADMAKDEAKRAVEKQKELDEEERQAESRRAEVERKRVLATLPAEPGPTCTEPICSVKCRLPTGKFVSRKFLQSAPLKILLDFLMTEGYTKDKFKFLYSYPKKDLLEAHPETQQMGNIFSPQDTLIVEGR
jgi:FAS-associated factor 2